MTWSILARGTKEATLERLATLKHPQADLVDNDETRAYADVHALVSRLVDALPDHCNSVNVSAMGHDRLMTLALSATG